MSGSVRRPRLADRVTLRQFVEGDEAWAVLRDDTRGLAIQVGPREAAVILASDGTRDAEGIALAVRRVGVTTSAGQVGSLLAELEGRDLLVDGPPEHDPEVGRPAPRDPDVPADRPVRGPPGYAYACDGRGGCCSQYDAVLFTPSDRARAMAAYPFHDVGPWPLERAFTPEQGSAPSPIRVGTVRDGACMFLEPDGACGIHRRHGADAKPTGCRLFPLRLVDDGEIIRATAMTECRCIVAEAPPGTEPLAAAGTTLADLDPLAVVRTVPETVRLDGARTWSRAELRAWGVAAVEASATSSDPATWWWREADRLGAASLPLHRARAYFRVLARRALSFCRQREQTVRATTLTEVARWVGTAAGVLTDADLATTLIEEGPTASDRRVEALVAQLVLWGYVGLGRRPVVTWLRDRAVRTWVARAMAQMRPDALGSPAFDHPITVLDAVLRGQGLRDYVDDVAVNS